MLQELCADNLQLMRFLRATHEVCDRHGDVATASLIEAWIDETERRTWFLSEIACQVSEGLTDQPLDIPNKQTHVFRRR
jgi:starvation-inducible DNA-binding protein